MEDAPATTAAMTAVASARSPPVTESCVRGWPPTRVSHSPGSPVTFIDGDGHDRCSDERREDGDERQAGRVPIHGGELERHDEWGEECDEGMPIEETPDEECPEGQKTAVTMTTRPMIGTTGATPF